MKKEQRLITKAGPRLINLLADVPEIDILITAPGMLFQRLDLISNLSAFDGCDAGFYRELAQGLEGTVFCGHKPPVEASIKLEPHRVGLELSIELGPPTMYQSLLRLRTLSGRTFKDDILNLLGVSSGDGMIVVLFAVRAEGHHEQHHSARKQISERAHTSHGLQGEGHNGH